MIGLINSDIEKYAMSKTSLQSKLLDNLIDETYQEMSMPQMLSGHLEGRFLKIMVEISQAKNILEIGMFTGYSALSMAEGLPNNGHLTTLEIDEKAIGIAKKYINQSNYKDQITILAGNALENIKKMSGMFDLVFIDADKTNYFNYYEAVMPKVKSGGLILVDNTLWGGEVLNPHTEDGIAIDNFNNKIMQDPNVSIVMLTIRDGVTLIRKK